VALPRSYGGFAGNKPEAFGYCLFLKRFETGVTGDSLTGFHFNFAQGKASLELEADVVILGCLGKGGY
jgi:hypothetical protein